MAVRLESTYYTEKGAPVLLRLWDSDFSGSTTAFDCERLEVQWRGDDARERFSPVIGSECLISIVVNSSTLETFVEDLVGAEEGRFTVSMGIFSGLSAPFSWSGYITTDNVRIEDTTLEVGYRVEIRAVDGIGRLKSIDYNDDGTAYTGKETFVQHVLKCLNKLPFITSLFGPSDTLLNVVANWHENSYTYAAMINPMHRARVSHGAFYYRDTKGNTVYSTCFDVLEEICTAWGARLMFSGNAFWLVQVNEYENADSLTVFRYTKGGTETVSSAQNLTMFHFPNTSGNKLLRYSGGSFEFFVPLKSVQVDYRHVQSRNLLAGYVWTDTNTADVTVEDIDDSDGTARLSYTGTLTITSSWINVTGPAFQPHYVILAFKVRVESFYLNGDITISPSGAVAGNMEWNNTDTSRMYVVTPVFTEDGQTISFPVNFITPPLEQAGTLTINFDKFKAYYGADEIGFVVGDPYLILGYQLTNNYLELLGDGTFENQADIYRYKATNNASASKRVELVTSIGDGPNLASPGHIEVLDDADEWVISDAWRIGNAGDYKAHSQLLANETVRGQLLPVRKFAQMPFQNLDGPANPYRPHLAIDYDSAYWVFLSGRFNVATEIWQGDWFRLALGTGYTEETMVLIPKDQKDGVPTSGSTGGTAPSGGSSTTTGGGSTTATGNTVRVFREEFLDDATGVLVITEFGGALPVVQTQIQVFMNGQKLLPVQYSIVSDTITIDSDTHYSGANYEVYFTIIQ